MEPTDAVWNGTQTVIDPPQAVLVDLAAVLRPSRVGMRNVPLRVRAGGIDLLPVQARLHAWHETITQDTFGLVEMTVGNRTGRAALTLLQLVPEAAVRWPET